MSSRRVTISARTIHALLAGQLAPERYLESHEHSARILEIALKEGRSIRAVNLETSEIEDDDWLSFEFGEPNPEIQLFASPPLNSKRVTFSARRIHALLAGQLSPEEYMESHGDRVRVLECALKQGRSIRAVHLDVSKTDDDDCLTFEFGEPDPAIHPFVSPPRETAE